MTASAKKFESVSPNAFDLYLFDIYVDFDQA